MGRRKARGTKPSRERRAAEAAQRQTVRGELNCEAKSGRYPNEVEASRAAGQIKAQSPGARQMRPYHCEYCGLWHLTRGPQGE